MKLNGKEIDEKTLLIENVWETEHDEDGIELEEEEKVAVILVTYAEYTDGIELTHNELEKLNEEERELIEKRYNREN